MSKFRLLMLASVMATGAASSAYAADLIIDERASVGVVEAAAGNWDGMYVGVFGGAAMGTADHTNAVFPSPCAPDGCDLDLSGWLVGVDAGANFYLSDKVVGGVAADLAWSNISGSDAVPFDTENSINWQGSVRGVLGFDAGAIMPYLTAGVAFANASHSSTFGSADATHIGWTAGVGVAIAATDTMSIDLQYRHSQFNELEYDEGTPFNPVFGLSTDAVTVGINFAL